MRDTWITGQLSFAPVVMDEVLVEYDGPQAAMFTVDTHRCFGMASDESDELVRWVLAQVSGSEERALRQGACTPYDVLAKDSIYIVDFDRRGHIQHQWTTSSAELYEDDLPFPADPLPYTEVQYAPATPEIIFDGAAVDDHRVPFQTLGEQLANTQTLWNALAQRVFAEDVTARAPVSKELRARAQLYAGASQQSSYKLSVEAADSSAFDRIAQRYSEILGARDNIASLSKLLREDGPRVAAAYKRFIGGITKHGIEVTTAWHRGFTFVGPSTARRVHGALEATYDAEHTDIEVLGYLIGFNTRDRRFEFYDIEADEKYTGFATFDIPKTMSIGEGIVYHAYIRAMYLSGLGTNVQYILEHVEVVPSVEDAG